MSVLARTCRRHRPQQFTWLLLSLVVCLQSSCALFQPSPLTSHSANHGFLPPLQAAPEAIQLEVYFLERPAEDHLLACGVWKEVDQIGALPSETREVLSDNGFRVGHVSSNPPPSVQRLLGLVAEIPSGPDESSKPLLGRRQFLAPGIETEIPTGIEHEYCHFLVYDRGQSKSMEFERATCVLRMKAHRLQDGWVRVDFQPEIHHGDLVRRTTPTEEGWAQRFSQNIDVMQPQRFSVTMNVGELALITATNDQLNSLGDRFFCHEDRGVKRQRVLVVRIVDSGKAT